jgi:hypothetical protein
MAPLDFLIHLLNFILPAVVVGALVALVSPWVLQRRAPRSLWRQSALNAAAGAVALLAGLAFFGNDGKMATYAAMCALVATCQWWSFGKKR